MTEKETKFIEDQFKSIGALKALTPELMEQMKKGVQQIQHAHSEKYEGDGIASAVFYLNKGNDNNYFLNKWDMHAIKEGETEGLKQTFHNNHFRRKPDSENYDPEKYYTTFTFKSSYNYLQGRPVHNSYKNDNNQNYQAWDLLQIKKGEEGKVLTEKKHYHENYPFDLEKVLNNYSILELTKPEYKQRFIESQERGNLQLATFVGEDGKKEKLYVSPNIPFGAINIYDLERQRVPTQTLVDKGYIGKEFAQHLKERVEPLKQKNENGTSQKQEQPEKNEQKQKQDVVKDEKEAEKVTKENKQRQTHKASVNGEQKARQRNRHKQRLQ